MSGDKARKLIGLRKTSDVTLKRGSTASAEAPSATELKKLPGKRKPPTLTLKRGKNQSL
jgi:hypothetical protein